ncbi:MAG: hypothetical protein L0Y44_08885, partial [Phycisphaerales bacterium]|nr:hypothetical protein [Phycisphaerales bacterium]
RKHIMSIFLAGIDELTMFPSDEQRQKALDELGKAVKVWELIFAIVTVVVVACGINYGLKEFIKWVAPNMDRTTREIVETVRLIFVIGSAFLVMRMLHRWGVRTELRAKLLEAGVPVCQGCGYLLRGLPSQTGACPECGRGIDEPVRTILQASETVPQAQAGAPDGR